MADIELDLTPYAEVRTSRRNYGHAAGDVWLAWRDSGLKAAKELGILKLVPQLQNGDLLKVKLPPGCRINESFMKAFFGPAARKMGVAEFRRVLTVIGGIGAVWNPGTMW